MGEADKGLVLTDDIDDGDGDDDGDDDEGCEMGAFMM